MVKLKNTHRVRSEDERFEGDLEQVSFENHLFIRCIAKEQRFTRVNFRYSVFDACYLRKCTFVSCNFTGCRFVGSQFHGSTFTFCTFDYSTFERTYIDEKILESECPKSENVRERFARTLRMNYQQIGDARAANLAIRVELAATAVHLQKAAWSKESYFREKYRGSARLAMLRNWARFKLLDIIWGNGESLTKLLRSILVLLIGISVYSVWRTKDHGLISSYLQAMIESPQVFFGSFYPPGFSKSALALIVALRLLSFGLFVALVGKRYNRR